MCSSLGKIIKPKNNVLIPYCGTDNANGKVDSNTIGFVIEKDKKSYKLVFKNKFFSVQDYELSEFFEEIKK